MAAHLKPLKAATQYNIINTGTVVLSDPNHEMFSRVPHRIGGGAVTHMALVFDGWYVQNTSTGASQPLGNDYTVTSAVIEYNGVAVPLTFDGGNATKLVVNGATNIITDELNVLTAFGVSELPYNTEIYVKCRLSVDIGVTTRRMLTAPQRTSTIIPNSQFLRGQTSSGVGSNTAPGVWSTTGTAANTIGYTPLVVGRHTSASAVAIMAHGDSLTAGVGDSGASTMGHGWLGRSLDSFTVKPGFINFGISGCTLLAGATDAALLPHYSYCNVGFSNAATNDFGLGAVVTVGTALTRQNNLIARMKNYGIRKVGVMCLLPRTTSIDSWATVANQVIYGTWGVGGNPATYNTSIKSASYDAVVLHDGIRAPEDQYKWISDGVANKYTADGTHPAIDGYLPMSVSAKPTIEELISAALVPVAYVSAATGNWNDTTKWTPAGVPTELDTVSITPGHTITVPSGFTAKHKGLTLNGTSGNISAVVISGVMECHGNITKNPNGSATGSPTMNGYSLITTDDDGAVTDLSPSLSASSSRSQGLTISGLTG